MIDCRGEAEQGGPLDALDLDRGEELLQLIALGAGESRESAEDAIWCDFDGRVANVDWGPGRSCLVECGRTMKLGEVAGGEMAWHGLRSVVLL